MATPITGGGQGTGGTNKKKTTGAKTGVGNSSIKSSGARTGVGLDSLRTQKGEKQYGSTKGTAQAKPNTGFAALIAKLNGGQSGPGALAKPRNNAVFGQTADMLKQLGDGVLAGSQPKTFADYLAEANAMSSSEGGGTDFGALEANLRNNARDGSAKLASMYKALRGSIDADAVPIAGNYDRAQGELKTNSDTAAAQTNAAYNASRSSQTEQLQALGIGDTAGVLAANGGQAARDQQFAANNIAQNAAANQNLNAQNKTAALNYNTGIGNAAGLEGAVQQSALQQQLAAKLAELQVAKSQESSSRQSNNTSLATTLADFDNAAAQRRADARAARQPDVKGDLANQLTAQQIIKMKQETENRAAAQGNTPESRMAAAQQTYAGMGGDPSDMAGFAEFAKTLKLFS